jgi:high-affinity iron transporter
MLISSIGGGVSAGEIIGRVHYPAGIDGRRSPAVAYLVTAGIPGSSQPATVTVDQRDREFVPRVQAMALGGSIVFRNSDPEAHNVNSQSGCCSFNCMIAPATFEGAGQSEPMMPVNAGIIRLLCNIHSQMRGFVIVCPSSLFAIADEQGNFRIRDIPEGTHKLVVWQESSVQWSLQIEMASEVRVNVGLERHDSVQVKSPAILVRPVQPWRAVLQQIRSKLETAVVAAVSGSAAESDQLALDAYFECFEASEMETAILLFRGEERKFVLERMFARIRRPLLSELAAGRGSAESVRGAIGELVREIELDIAALNANGVRDRTCVGSTELSATRVTSNRITSVNIAEIMAALRRAFDDVAGHAVAGDSTAAAAALADSYFQIFHRIEPALAAHAFIEVRRIEGRFLELRGRIRSGISAQDIRANLDDLWADIDRAAYAMTRPSDSGFRAAMNRFWNAFVILTREGVEAILIITSLLLCLGRSKRPEAKQWIYGGIVLAVVATVCTWSGLQWVITQSGIAQETIEGIAALAAGAVLFYVSYWLVSKSEGRRWQQFLADQVDRNLSSGGRWAIGLAAFLAVYREGAETILMFQPMLVNPSANELVGTAVGIIASLIALAGVFWGLRYASFRMAIRPFFRLSGALLFTLSVVFAGKGIAELQEARVLTISPLPSAMDAAIMAIPSAIRDALGITPTVQSVLIQATILAGVLLSVLSMWLLAPRVTDPESSTMQSGKNLVRHSTV